jgi:hypothetical protein
MTIRTTLAGITAAVVLGTGALIGGSLATATSAEAAPGWHGRGHHGHFGHDYRRPGRYWGHHRGWGHRGWGYRPAFYGGCYTVMRVRFVPGFGPVERPVTRCH